MSTTILVVDDEQRMRTLIKDFLVKKDYQVIEAKDRRRSIGYLSRKKFANRPHFIRCDDAKARWLVGIKANQTKLKSTHYHVNSKR